MSKKGSKDDASLGDSVASASRVNQIWPNIHRILPKITGSVFINPPHPNAAAPRDLCCRRRQRRQRRPAHLLSPLHVQIHLDAVVQSPGGGGSDKLSEIVAAVRHRRADAEALGQDRDLSGRYARGVSVTDLFGTIRQASDVEIPCFAQNPNG
ncbi:hypothetical protein U1Q18_046071 [Sarracenia purpurea var. burkii]